MENVKYIVFSGGGQKGLLFMGAIKALRQHTNFESILKNARGFSGCSVGAIFAAMMIMGYTDEEMYEELSPVVSSFDNIAPQMDVSLFISRYGFDDGSTLKKSISNIIEFKGFSPEINLKNFQRFFKAEISFNTTNLTTRENVILSASTFPDLKLVDAIFMSMCVPLLFAPVLYKENFYVDGGCMCNIPDIYPVHETMIFCFDQANMNIDSWNSYVSMLLTIPMKLDFEKKQQMLNLCAFNMFLKTPPFLKDSLDRNITNVKVEKCLRYGYCQTIFKIHSNIIATMETLLKVVISAYLYSCEDSSIESAECLL